MPRAQPPYKGAATAADPLAERVQAACLGTRVSRLHRLVARRYDAALRPLGMSVQQMEILTALSLLDPEPTRPAQLASWLLADRSTMSRNLTSLVDRGWVSALTVSRTGRALEVGLTQDGREVYKQVEPLWQAVQDTTLDELGARSVTTLDRWLDHLQSDQQ